MSPGARVVAAARGAIGVRFRLHGRDPAFGLDCVGLAALALRAGGCRAVVPTGYALRGGDPAALCRAIDAAGLVRAARKQPGDLALFDAGTAQLHLGIISETGVIHADAALRRVVERPGPPPWAVIAAWRIGPDQQAGS